MMDKRLGRGIVTRQRIIGTAIRLFTADGYEATAIERVLRECDCSRGALYHHFASKEALFAAAFEAVEERVLSAISTAAADIEDPRTALGAASAAWLALAANDAEVRRIVLIDAPVALGWRTWRALEARYGLGLIKAGLARAANLGALRAEQVDLYAHLLLAALTETALMVARADDPEGQMQLGLEALDRLLDGLIGPARSPG